MDPVTTRRAAALMLTLSMVIAGVHVVNAQPQPGAPSIFLRGTGAPPNPGTLFLDTTPPPATVPRTKDAGTLRYAGGNTWKEIGTWQAAPFVVDGQAGPFGTFVMALEPLRIWLGLLNSDDQGTKFDLKVEMFKNNIVVPIAEGMLRCIAGLTRNPNKATEVALSPVLVSPQLFNGTTDVLRLELSARIGTNDDNTRCAGSHASAVGLRAYFDAVRRDARFDVELSGGNELIGEISADIVLVAAPTGESPMGDLVADAHLSATRSAGAQIALINPAFLRANLLFAAGPGNDGNGDVTYVEAFRVLPFGERLVTMTLTGAQLKDVLEQQFPGFRGQLFQRILGVSAGVTYTWSDSAALGAKISNLTLDGIPIDPAASYRVTVNGFLARGGDSFSTLTGGSNGVTSSESDLDALIDYLGLNSPVAPPPLNRIARDA